MEDPASHTDVLLLMEEQNMPKLSEDQTTEITNFLIEQDESRAGVHIVAKKFKVKRLQLLAADFSLAPPGRQSTVAPPGFPEPEPLEPGSQPKKNNANRATQRAAAQAGPELTPEQQEEINGLIVSNDGVYSLALIGSTHGIKTGQLEAAGYVLGPRNEHGQRSVALPGQPEPPPPDSAIPGEKKSKKRSHRERDMREEDMPALTDEEVEKITSFLVLQPESAALCGSVCKQFRIKRHQLQVAGFSLSPHGRNSAVAPPGFPEPVMKADNTTYEDLPEEKNAEILQFLEERGGVADVAQIGGMLKVKVPQLEAAGFVLSEKNANGQRHVSAPGSERPEPPPTGVKRQKMDAAGKGGMNPMMMMMKGKGGADGKAKCAKMMQCMNMMWQVKGSDMPWEEQNAMMQNMFTSMKGSMMSNMPSGKGGSNKRKGPDPSEPAGPLSEEQHAEIMQFMLENEDVTVSVLGSKFGMNKARQRLAASGFVIGPANEKGQMGVAPPGFPIPLPPAGKAPKESIGELSQDAIADGISDTSLVGVAPDGMLS